MGVVAIIDGKPRYSGVLGALMAMNLWLRLYRAPYEWPWAYFFLMVLQTTVVVLHAGKSLGLDAILARREQAQSKADGVAARALAYLTWSGGVIIVGLAAGIDLCSTNLSLV
jgi:hypothetical protein